MKGLGKKLHSESGASMMLALLFLFFCLMTGAIVLTAASANAGRTARIESEQQHYLAVESAALLLRDDLRDMAFVGSYEVSTKTTYSTMTVKDAEGKESSYTVWETTGPSYVRLAPQLTGTELAGLLRADLDAIYQSGTTIPDRPSAPDAPQYELTLDASMYGEQLDATATITIDPATYDLTVLLRDSHSGNATKLFLQASAAPRQSFHSAGDNPRTDTTTYATTVTWAEAVITKGA